MAAAAYRTGSRLRGRRLRQGNISVVARAAYRSGERLHDAQIDKTFDFRRKERVDYAAIYTHEYRPAWAIEREPVWNGVEAIERRKDARLAKDITAALPRDLSLKQHIALVEEFVTQEFVSRGLIADVAIHNKRSSDGGENPHVHIMLTTRPITPEGFGKKDRDLDKQEILEAWRKSYEAICNRHLEEAGSTQRISLDSYKTRGLDRIPGVHLGHESWNLEKRGVETTRGNINREARHVNGLRDLLNAQGLDLEAPPTLTTKPDRAAKTQHRPEAPLPLGTAEERQPGHGLAELARQATEGDQDDGETRHRKQVQTLARNLASPVIQARMAVIRHVNRLRAWWEDKFQERTPEPEPRQSVFDRYQRDDLAKLAQRQRKERDHER